MHLPVSQQQQHNNGRRLLGTTRLQRPEQSVSGGGGSRRVVVAAIHIPCDCSRGSAVAVARRQPRRRRRVAHAPWGAGRQVATEASPAARGSQASAAVGRCGALVGFFPRGLCGAKSSRRSDEAAPRRQQGILSSLRPRRGTGAAERSTCRLALRCAQARAPVAGGAVRHRQACPAPGERHGGQRCRNRVSGCRGPARAAAVRGRRRSARRACRSHQVRRCCGAPAALPRWRRPRRRVWGRGRCAPNKCLVGPLTKPPPRAGAPASGRVP